MKKSNINENFSEADLKLKFIYEDLRRKKLDTQSRFLFQTTIIVTILFTTVFSTLLVINPNDRKDLLLFPFISRGSSSDTETVDLLKTQVVSLQGSVNALQTELNSIKNQPPESRDISTIKAQINNLSTNLENLNETILEKPDTAITAKLLREKQNSIDQKIDDVTKNQQRLEDRVDSFLSNLIAVPIFGALAGLAFTTIAAVSTPILTRIKEAFSNGAKNSTIKEL